MVSTSQRFGLLAFQTVSPRDAVALLASASALQHDALAGTLQPLLRGKQLGLLCEDGNHADADLFRRAAKELGARVAHVRPSLSVQSTPLEIEHTARMLGRLYDAVECQGLGLSLVEDMALAAGVPVYDGIATPEHPTAVLAARLVGEGSPADKRRFVLQAALLSSLA
jgi:ornithine carbamoyltransferase